MAFAVNCSFCNPTRRDRWSRDGRRTDSGHPTKRSWRRRSHPMTLDVDEKETLGEAMFGSAELGDRRRTARLGVTFDQLRRPPGGTLPNKVGSPPDLKALSRLMDRPEVTHESLLAPMRAYALRHSDACRAAGLLSHDAP